MDVHLVVGKLELVDRTPHEACGNRFNVFRLQYVDNRRARECLPCSWTSCNEEEKVGEMKLSIPLLNPCILCNRSLQ